MVDGNLRGDLEEEGRDKAEPRETAPDAGAEPLDEARIAFTSRLASFGLGEATQRLLEASGLVPGRRAKRTSPIRDDLRLG